MHYVNAQIYTKYGILWSFVYFQVCPSAISKLMILKENKQNKTNNNQKTSKISHKALSYHSDICKSVFPDLLLTTFNSCSSATELLGQQSQRGIFMGPSCLLHLCFASTNNKRALSFGKQNLEIPAVLGSPQLSK